MTGTNLFKTIMNRFLNKKKSSGEDPLSPAQSGKKWRKNKKAPVEQKPQQIDLAIALPPTDDFRTSLIMPTLSTRFSMLREQDDPSTKLGKASDDSVLQPQRQSRLLDFGFNSTNLNDIAEVASINSSIRPPFARERHDSYGSEEGYGTDNDSSINGSMMTRSRPGEGNVLFGGRQKVYKIATGSAKSISGASERGMGKVLYDDDVHMSAFQKYRQQQQQHEPMGRPAPGTALSMYDEPETEDSPILGDDHSSPRNSEEPVHGIGLGLSHPESAAFTFKRSSDSTTNSGPSQGRSSSAATSVASQSIGTAVTTSIPHPLPTSIAPAPPLERSLTKRRLYEQGLEKNMYEQQASTLTRLNSIQRQRSPTVGSIKSPPALSHSKSISHMQDRAFQPYALQTSSQSAVNAFPPLALRKLSSSNSSPVASHPQSPLSPTMSESEHTLHSAMEPNDRGKATAMGAFNKPQKQYDEQQYMQRQAQLQQSNQPGPSRQNSVELARQSDARLARFDSARQTSESRASQRSRSRSVSSRTEQVPNKAFSVFQNAAIQNRVVHGDNPNLPPAVPLPVAPSSTDTHRTFFGDISASDDEEEEEDDILSDFERSGPQYAPNSYMTASSSGRFTPTPLPSVSEHPALRHESTPNIPEVDEEEEQEEESVLPSAFNYFSPIPTVNTVDTTLPRSSSEYREVDPQDIDSPTIGTKDGLGGLIHHLRNTSDQSSIYPIGPAFSGVPSLIDENYRGVPGSHGLYDENANQTYSTSNAWDLDDLENYYGEAIADRPYTQRDSTPSKGQPLGPAYSKANIDASRPSTKESDVIDGALWQNEFKKQHTRDTSTATQAERQAFDDELAARQRAIQEKMKSIVESESRATSPAPSAGGALKAFGMLKSKPSHEAMSRDNKAMKMLGMGAQGGQQDKYSIYEDPQANASRVMPQGNAWAPPTNAQWPLAGPAEQKSVTNLQGTRGVVPVETGMRDARGVNGRTPPQHPANRERSRTRSNSATSRTRSRSRTGGPREGYGSPPEVPQVPAARPSIDTFQSRTPPSVVEGQGRMRSNSKAGGYFDPRALHPAHGGTPTSRGTPGGISPVSVSSSVVYPPSMGSTPRPPFSSTPSSASKNGSPAMAMPPVQSSRPAGSLLRKKTINKADISEPTLISSTSNVDTVDLPTARTIVQPPLIPALNPRRRVFPQGPGGEVNSGAFSPPMPQHAATFAARQGPGGEVNPGAFSPPMPQHAATFAARPSEGWNEGGAQRNYPRTVRSQESIDARATRFDAVGSPVMNDAGMF